MNTIAFLLHSNSSPHLTPGFLSETSVHQRYNARWSLLNIWQKNVHLQRDCQVWRSSAKCFLVLLPQWLSILPRLPAVTQQPLGYDTFITSSLAFLLYFFLPGANNYPACRIKTLGDEATSHSFSTSALCCISFSVQVFYKVQVAGSWVFDPIKDWESLVRIPDQR